MGQIKVTFGALQQGVADINSTSGNLQGQLSDLENYLKPIVSTWTGEAAELYQAKQAEWNTAQENLNTILRQIGNALSQASDDFAATERANANMWG